MAFTALATKVYKDPLTVIWMNSIKANDDILITGSNRFWAVWDGATATMTSLANHNVSNILDNAAGDYTLTFTTTFTGSSYATYGGIVSSATSETVHVVDIESKTSATVRIAAKQTGSGNKADKNMMVAGAGVQ